MHFIVILLLMEINLCLIHNYRIDLSINSNQCNLYLINQNINSKTFFLMNNFTDSIIEFLYILLEMSFLIKFKYLIMIFAYFMKIQTNSRVFSFYENY